MIFLERIGKKIDKAMEIYMTIIFILMVLVGGMQVFNRYIINHSLSWSEEFNKFLAIWLIFFTIPVVYNCDSNIGMKVLYNKFPAQREE